MTEMSPPEAIFFSALELPPGDRAAFLAQACAGIAGLRSRIEKMLAAQSHLGGFLDQVQTAAAPDPGRTGPAEAPGAVIAGRYKLIQRIGEGGMGSVWRADQLEPVRRHVAVKLIRSERGSSQAILARFEAERQALALMDHPNIARVLDGGTTGGGRPYFVMDLVKGVPITKYCDEHHLTPRQRLELFVPVCSAVQHAHQKGIIHRDLKPSNILVESHEDRPVPKVIDFGLAKALSGQPLTEHTLFTSFGTVAGTPLYMAPEQARFNAIDVDTRADVYSLGVILYELLTGTTPVERAQLKAAAFDDILRVIRECEPTTPSKRLSSSDTQPAVAANRQTEPVKLCRLLRGDLDWIVMKALAKERDRRYETASGLARDIERFLNHEPVLAGPPSAAYRLKKFVRRNRAAVMAGCLLLLALLIGLAGTTWGLIHADRARRAEAEQRARAEAREAQAIDAVKKFRDAVANEPELKNSPQLEGLRKRLLKEPLAFFRDLRDRLQADRDTRPESLARLADASTELGALTAAIGDLQDAMIAYREALAIYQKLADDNPGNIDFRSALAGSHHNLGNALCKTSKPAEAEAEYREAIALSQKVTDEDPAVARYWLFLANHHGILGVLLKERERPAEALEAYEAALAIYQKLADADPTVTEYQYLLAGCHYNLGNLLRAAGKPAEALKAYKAALAIAQKHADADPPAAEFQSLCALIYGGIGAELRASGKPAEALKAYRAALAIAQQLADANPTVSEFQNHLARNHESIGFELSTAGRPAEALKSYQAALSILQKLADANPTVTEYQSHVARSHEGIGFHLRAPGKPAEALKSYRAALAIAQKLADSDPAVTGHQTYLAHLHRHVGSLLRAGKPAEAMKAFESALTINQRLAREHPESSDIASELGGSLHNVAAIHLGAGRFEEARALVRQAVVWQRKALAADPARPTYRQFMTNHLISLTRAARGLKDAAGVVEAARQLIEFDPNNAAGHANLGTGLAEQGARDAAIPSFRKAIDLDPKDAQTRYNLGQALREKGEVDEAIASYRKATELHPGFAESHNNLGALLCDRKRDYEAAAACFRKLLELKPDDPGAHFCMGNALLGGRQFDGAIACFYKAIELGPRLAYPYGNLSRALLGKGSYPEAGAAAARALALLPEKHPSRAGLTQRRLLCERLAKLEPRFPRLLKGEESPASAREALDVSLMCQHRQMNAAAARFAANAYAADPKLGDDLATGLRSEAACRAALAAAGKGEDAGTLDDKERARLRKQALDWLRADLTLRARQLEGDNPSGRQAAQSELWHWQRVNDLAGLRDEAALAKLPAEERAACAGLWADVAALLKKSETRTK